VNFGVVTNFIDSKTLQTIYQATESKYIKSILDDQSNEKFLSNFYQDPVLVRGSGVGDATSSMKNHPGFLVKQIHAMRAKQKNLLKFWVAKRKLRNCRIRGNLGTSIYNPDWNFG
jgi:hypothetical protein